MRWQRIQSLVFVGSCGHIYIYIGEVTLKKLCLSEEEFTLLNLVLGKINTLNSLVSTPPHLFSTSTSWAKVKF